MLQWCESYLSACQCTLFRCCRSALFRLKAWLQKVHLNRLISEWTSHMWRFMLLRLWNSFPQTGHRKSASLNESNFPLCNGSPKEKKNNVWELYIFGEICGFICKLDHVTKYVSHQKPISKRRVHPFKSIFTRTQNTTIYFKQYIGNAKFVQFLILHCCFSFPYFMHIKQMLCQYILSFKRLLTQWTTKRPMVRVWGCHMPLHASEMLNSLRTNWTLERVLLFPMIWFTMLFVCC